ncbi:hypothetical protein ACFQNF_12720 [Iodobacter arcticus]|uniref:Uncharacterized protein n=1 Tax=Iodobacter arcticus TaxID=590593 RepID=A0ABW2QYQ7_9NEIS
MEIAEMIAKQHCPLTPDYREKFGINETANNAIHQTIEKTPAAGAHK